MVDLVGPIAAMPVPLHRKLLLLRERADEGARMERLVRWAAAHPEVAAGSDWCRRAWWGAAAGEVVRDHLYDPARRGEALDLLDDADFSPLDGTGRQGGLVVVAAHLGPPKFLMNCLLERRLPLLVWTNTRDLPTWLADRGGTFLDPMRPDERAALLVRSALHLRRGGVLVGAADQATGDRTVVLERLGMRWRFSLGLPALARSLGAPAIGMLAVWRGERIRIECRPLPTPDPALDADAWHRAWLEAHWRAIEPTIRESPENLRFLRWAVERVARPWDSSEAAD